MSGLAFMTTLKKREPLSHLSLEDVGPSSLQVHVAFWCICVQSREERMPRNPLGKTSHFQANTVVLLYPDHLFPKEDHQSPESKPNGKDLYHKFELGPSILQHTREGPEQCECLLFIARKLQGNKEILLVPALSVEP